MKINKNSLAAGLCLVALFGSLGHASPVGVKRRSARAVSTGGGGAQGAQGPAGTVVGSTQTITFKIAGGVYLSTIDVCGIPGACTSFGFSTITVIGIWADENKGSTVGWTRVDLAFSTGGVNSLPVSFRFPPISVSTAGSAGVSALSVYTATTVPINPFEWLGVMVSSLPASGLTPTDLRVHLDYWEKSRF